MPASSQPTQHRIKRILALAFALSVAMIATASPPATDTLGRADMLWLERITYGIDSNSIDNLRAVGRRRFLDEQLSGHNDTLPKPVQAQLDTMQIAHASAVTMFADERAAQQRMRAMPDGDAKLEARKARNETG